jgi:hypothetical protein
MTAIRHLKKAEQRLKTWEDYTFCRENYGQPYFSEGILTASYSLIF